MGLNKRRYGVLIGAVALVVALPAIAFAISGPFDDVPADDPFAGSIQWMKDNGITDGCNPPANTLYCPDDPVTRAEVSKFLQRTADLTTDGADGATGATGATGPAGPTGSDGSDGAGVVNGFYQVMTTRNVDSGQTAPGFVAECDVGDFVTGGGYRNTTGGWATYNGPSGDRTWVLSIFVIGDGAEINLWAQCADLGDTHDS